MVNNVLPGLDQVFHRLTRPQVNPCFFIVSQWVNSNYIFFETRFSLSRGSWVNPLSCLLLGYFIYIIPLAIFGDLTWICWCFVLLDFFLLTNFFFNFILICLDFFQIDKHIFFNFLFIASSHRFFSSLKYINSV